MHELCVTLPRLVETPFSFTETSTSKHRKKITFGSLIPSETAHKRTERFGSRNVPNLNLSTFSNILINQFSFVQFSYHHCTCVLNVVTHFKMELWSGIIAIRGMSNWIWKSRYIWMIYSLFSKYRRFVNTPCWILHTMLLNKTARNQFSNDLSSTLIKLSHSNY